jgi:hypothetical protein
MPDEDQGEGPTSERKVSTFRHLFLEFQCPLSQLQPIALALVPVTTRGLLLGQQKNTRMKHTFQQQSPRPTGGALAAWSRSRTRTAGSLQYLAATTALTALVGLTPAKAADVTYNFDAGQPAGVAIGGNNDAMFVATGGNPAGGGFMAVTYPVNSQTGIVVFDNTDPGKVVTGFSFSCDLRVGNSTGDRAADGFSISFARDGDPFLTSLADSDLGGNCCAETGTKTGIAVSFDTWSGNNFPTDPNDTTDIEGIIVRVDNVTVRKIGLPTRHGTADDITSLQTGPRDAAYWANGGDPLDPAAWATLAWRQFAIDLTSEGKLSVTWKGNKVLDGEQTTYFPSAGQLVFAGRTGGANEHTHVDNIRLVTTAQTVTATPGAPPNLKAAELGSRRVRLTWDAAVVAGDPNARVAYEVERDGVVIAPLLTTLGYVDRGVSPSKSYTYKVRGKNIAGLSGPDATLPVTTVSDVPGVGFLRTDIWLNIAGNDPAAGIGDPHFSDPPDTTRYVNGFGYGETTAFGNTFGDSYVSVVSGVFTAPKSGSFRFFARADDGVAIYLNTAGAAIPDVATAAPIQATDGTACCQPFLDVAADGTVPPQTSEPVALVAGKQYGIALVVKEGGGGDWGQLAIREEGDPTPAAQLSWLHGAVVSGPVDAVGASISITQSPVDTTAGANSPVTFTSAATGSSPYGGDYGNAISWQWYINGTAVLGANSSSYTIPVLTPSLNNAKFKVVAAVAGANASSAEATLIVTADVTAPTVEQMSGSETFDSVTVTFSEPVTDPTAVAVGNYSFTGLTVSSATRVNDRTVRLATSKQTAGSTYPATINGVKDNANLSSAFAGTFSAFQFKLGVAAFNIWNNQSGGFETFADITVPPNETRILTEYYTGAGLAENYFGQLKGIFVPETTGDYVFYVASDDHGEIYLSTNADPANKKKIAEEPSWSDPRLWNGDGAAANTGTRGEVGARANRSDEYADTQWSTGAGGKISLTAGQQYYLEVLYKEGGGGDHGGATFKLASAADPANGATALSGNLIGWFVDPNALPPIITARPVSVSFTNSQTISFTVTADSSLPVTYQWYQNKKAIAGATSATLSIASAGVGAVGDYYVVVTNKNGSATTFPDDDVRAILKGAFVIEAEDYNYDSGKTLAAASTMPLGDSLYQGKDGVQGVDFNIVENNADSACCGNSLRNGWVNAGVTNAAVAGANMDVVIDNGGGNQARPDFTLANNYKLGWGDTGEWYNYTRTFEAGKYSAVFIGSRDGRGAAAMGRTLELVTGDIAKPDAATTVLGQLTSDGTGGWSSNDNIPFLTPGASSVAVFDLAGTQTLRLRISSGDGDNDGLLIYKVTPGGGGGDTPVITGITVGADGKVTITWTGGGQLEAAETLGGTYAPVAGATGGSYVWDPGTTSIIYARVRN